MACRSFLIHNKIVFLFAFHHQSENVYFLGASRNLDFSKSETTVASDTAFESDYVTGLGDLSNEETEVKKEEKGGKGLSNPCHTSSFIQNILSEDCKTGVAVVDLFVAVKAVKDNLDFLARRNDDVFHQINVLNVESGVVRNEYRSLAEDMRSFLNELNGEEKCFLLPVSNGQKEEEIVNDAFGTVLWYIRILVEAICRVTSSFASLLRQCLHPSLFQPVDETIIERLLRGHNCDPVKCDKARNKAVYDLIERLRSKCSNSVGYPDSLASTIKSSTRPRISKTLLGSFLASILWLEKREASLSKSVDGDGEEKPSISDSTVQIICDMCEMLGTSADSTSEDGESETEEPDPDFPKKSDRTEDIDSDSAFDEAFATPPPSPLSSFFELKSKPNDLTEEDKNKNVRETDGFTAPVAVTLLDEIKSTVRHNEPKIAVATDEVITGIDEEVEKFSEPAEFTISAGIYDLKKNEEIQSNSSDSLDNLIDFDSDELATSSLSGEDEMEEFKITNGATLKSDSKMIGNIVSKMATLKTPKPIFFEVLKCYPKLFMEKVVWRTAKIKPEENKGMKEQNNVQVVPHIAGEKREQEVVIENNNVDLVIYIQVEVEDSDKKEQLVLDFETNSFGTQTSSQVNEFPKVQETSESDISKKCETRENEECVAIASKKSVKTVAFADEVSEIFINKNIPCEPETTENAVTVTMKNEILSSKIYFEQLELCPICLIKRPKPFYRAERNVELEKALELIHEIENDIVDTKLSDAILILPRLELELRKHFKQKVKSLGGSEFSKSFETFFSAFDIWPLEEGNDTESESSGERFYNLLTLLGDLEKAVKASERSTEVELCGYDSSKIYGLLHALTENIRELEDCSNVTSLSQTLEIASRVDTAIREFENIVKRTPTEYIKNKSKKCNRKLKSRTSGEIPQHLKNVRKRVFQMVEEEAIDTEARLEKDSEKLDSLERENDEAMKFVEAFLEKTQRRASELARTRTELKELSESLAILYEEIVKATNLRKESSQEVESVESELDASEHDATGEAKQPVKETVSGLLLALGNLKSRARQKNELCKEILSSVSVEKEIKEHDASTRSSRSSFTAKNIEGLYSWVKDFKKIGDQNLYLSWTIPEGPLVDSLVGYEIFVNGKLNQKVRNPKRLQAILYSVDLSQMAEVLLYGLLENGFKVFLASVTYTTS